MKKIFQKLRNKLFLNAINKSLLDMETRLNLEIDEYYRKTEIKIDELHRRFDEAKNDLCQSNGEQEERLSIKIDDLHRRFDEAKHNLEVENNRNITELDVRIGNNIARLFTIYDTHKNTFAKYKRIFTGKSVVIVGAGPTVKKFTPFSADIYIGLNRVFKCENINFDFLFSIDKGGIADYYNEFFSYKNDTCIKLIGDQNIGINYQIPESVINGKNIFRYMTTAGQFADRFTYHIESEPLGNFQTVSLQAMQFALYTNPAKIYLVGIDCSPNGHFTGSTNFSETRTEEEFKNNMAHSIEDWKKLKDFAKTYYPDTEIISVNPVGLKGIFKDWYQTEGEEPK